MASEWVSYTLLQSREMVKRLLGRNYEVLSASAKEAGCSVQQLKTVMEKYMVLTEKERETMTAEEAGAPAAVPASAEEPAPGSAEHVPGVPESAGGRTEGG